MSELPCDGIRVSMQGQTISIPLDICSLSSHTKNGYESYTYSCDNDKNFYWNVWNTKDCSKTKPKSLPISVLMEKLNGTIIESKCENIKCSQSIIQNLYEINECGQSIDQNTKYSQSAMIPNQCIIQSQFSVKHKCISGKNNLKKVKSVYFSDQECKKKIKTYVSDCDINKVSYNVDTCTESGHQNQVGVVSDNCCIRHNV